MTSSVASDWSGLSDRERIRSHLLMLAVLLFDFADGDFTLGLWYVFISVGFFFILSSSPLCWVCVFLGWWFSPRHVFWDANISFFSAKPCHLPFQSSVARMRWLLFFFSVTLFLPEGAVGGCMVRGLFLGFESCFNHFFRIPVWPHSRVYLIEAVVRCFLLSFAAVFGATFLCAIFFGEDFFFFFFSFPVNNNWNVCSFHFFFTTALRVPRSLVSELTATQPVPSSRAAFFSFPSLRQRHTDSYDPGIRESSPVFPCNYSLISPWSALGRVDDMFLWLGFFRPLAALGTRSARPYILNSDRSGCSSFSLWVKFWDLALLACPCNARATYPTVPPAYTDAFVTVFFGFLCFFDRGGICVFYPFFRTGRRIAPSSSCCDSCVYHRSKLFLNFRFSCLSCVISSRLWASSSPRLFVAATIFSGVQLHTVRPRAFFSNDMS